MSVSKIKNFNCDEIFGQYNRDELPFQYQDGTHIVNAEIDSAEHLIPLFYLNPVFSAGPTGDRAPPPGYSADDFKIPTLEEALARFPDKLINVELKEDDGQGDYEQQMADLLLSYGRLEDLIVVSFDDDEKIIGIFDEYAVLPEDGRSARPD